VTARILLTEVTNVTHGGVDRRRRSAPWPVLSAPLCPFPPPIWPAKHNSPVLAPLGEQRPRATIKF